MKRLSREAAERALQERKGPDFVPALRAVPEGGSPSVVADAAAHLLAQGGNGPWFFARNCQALPVPELFHLLERRAAGRVQLPGIRAGEPRFLCQPLETQSAAREPLQHPFPVLDDVAQIQHARPPMSRRG